jgi:hypothetical protein
MASFFAREKDLTLRELDDLLEDTRKELTKTEELSKNTLHRRNKKQK